MSQNYTLNSSPPDQDTRSNSPETATVAPIPPPRNHSSAVHQLKLSLPHRAQAKANMPGKTLATANPSPPAPGQTYIRGCSVLRARGQHQLLKPSQSDEVTLTPHSERYTSFPTRLCHGNRPPTADSKIHGALTPRWPSAKFPRALRFSKCDLPRLCLLRHRFCAPPYQS